MEVFGNIEALKRAIEEKYASKIKDLKKEKEKQLAEVDRDLNKKLELLISHIKTVTDAEAKKAYSMILSEEKLRAKREFEEKREYIIESVFKEAEKKAKKIAHSSAYLDFVKKQLPREDSFSVVGDSSYYKKAFPELKIDKSITGLKFESSRVIYDFTLDNMIKSKRDVLRQEVNRILFN